MGNIIDDTLKQWDSKLMTSWNNGTQNWQHAEKQWDTQLVTHWNHEVKKTGTQFDCVPLFGLPLAAKPCLVVPSRANHPKTTSSYLLSYHQELQPNLINLTSNIYLTRQYHCHDIQKNCGSGNCNAPYVVQYFALLAVNSMLPQGFSVHLKTVPHFGLLMLSMYDWSPFRKIGIPQRENNS